LKDDILACVVLPRVQQVVMVGTTKQSYHVRNTTATTKVETKSSSEESNKMLLTRV
jgi:hypothetical protein